MNQWFFMYCHVFPVCICVPIPYTCVLVLHMCVWVCVCVCMVPAHCRHRDEGDIISCDDETALMWSNKKRRHKAFTD